VTRPCPRCGHEPTSTYTYGVRVVHYCADCQATYSANERRPGRQQRRSPAEAVAGSAAVAAFLAGDLDPTRLGAWHRRAVLERDDRRCRLEGCDEPATEVRRLVELADGGTNHASNLQSVCAGCLEALPLRAFLAGDVVPEKLSERQRQAVLERDDRRCRLEGCDEPATEVRRLVELADGGTNHASNLQSVCAAGHPRSGHSSPEQLQLFT
jgi:5-methylcytosine-specific restriction endonuclease McrA